MALLGSRNNFSIRDLHPPINNSFHVRMNECWVTLGATHKWIQMGQKIGIPKMGEHLHKKLTKIVCCWVPHV